MRFLHSLSLLLLGLASTQAMAWGNHTLASYRAFEKMPEVTAAANVTVEPLEAFLQAEQYTLEALLASQEAWALVNLEDYARRPAALAFRADPSRSDEGQRLAFLTALRVAPNSRFALYFQPDPWGPFSGTTVPNGVVSTLAETAGQGRKFLALKPGEQVSALNVLASACDEPDYGLDAYLWDDSPSTWGKTYGFGTQPFGNASLAWASQSLFHMGFMHESSVVYVAAPFAKRSLLLLRSQQYATLAALAFRTGHGYWGWRFAGLALHYVQDQTQPYRASLAPGISNFRLLSAHALAVAGLPAMQEELQTLLSNRNVALEKYLNELLLRDASRQQEGALEKALHNTDKDRAYPDWSERYLREVVSLQASKAGTALAQAQLAVMPAAWLSDPEFDFASREASINVLNELGRRDDAERARLDSLLADLLVNFGAHSRNALRGILRVGDPP